MQSPVIVWYQPDTAPFSFKSPDFSLCQQALGVAGFERVDCHNAAQLLSTAERLARRFPHPDILRTWMIVILCAGMAENAALANLLRTEQPQVGIAALVPDQHEDTQLLALQSGIDVWFTETSSSRLVMATMFGLIRRMGGVAPAALPGQEVQHWGLIDHAWKLRSPEGVVVSLSAGERNFMLALASAEAYYATYEQLSAVLGKLPEKTDDDRRERLSVIVSRIKRKFEAVGVDLPIRSVHRRGYVFGGSLGLVGSK